MRVGIDTTFLVQVSVREHQGHETARAKMAKRLAAGDVLVLAPQVLVEFIHVVTDARRFTRPLDMAEALRQAQSWWDAKEVERVAPTAASMAQFWRWMAELGLGRKRLLDNLLAATYMSHGVQALLTTDLRDYNGFRGLRVVVPA